MLTVSAPGSRQTAHVEELATARTAAETHTDTGTAGSQEPEDADSDGGGLPLGQNKCQTDSGQIADKNGPENQALFAQSCQLRDESRTFRRVHGRSFDEKGAG